VIHTDYVVCVVQIRPTLTSLRSPPLKVNKPKVVNFKNGGDTGGRLRLR
jgi:hypothetical protein